MTITANEQKLLTWLRGLYSILEQGPAQFSMTSFTNELDLPYKNNIGPILVNHGVISKSRRNSREWLYTWTANDKHGNLIQPNLHMVQAILTELAKLSHRSKGINYRPIAEVAPKHDLVQPVAEDILSKFFGMLKTDFTSKGLSEEEIVLVLKHRLKI